MAAVARTPAVSDVNNGSVKTRIVHSTTNSIPHSVQTSQICHLTEVDLARRWRLSERTLQSWRWKKTGPPYVKVVGKVLYRLCDIETFEADHLQGGR